MSFGPRNIKFSSILLNTLGTLIAGFIGSILLLIIVFFSSKVLSIPGTLEQAAGNSDSNPMFPFILSFMTFFATSATIFFSTIILQMTDPEKYRKNSVLYKQIGFFGIFTYICLTPIYIITGIVDYNNLMIVFIVHTLILAFGSSLFLEILSNYRYILVGVYGSFFGIFFSSILTILLFTRFETGYAKLMSLLLILPLIYTSMTFFRGIFELMYYKYNSFTNLDPLGDILYQIEYEAQEAMKEEEQKNTL